MACQLTSALFSPHLPFKASPRMFFLPLTPIGPILLHYPSLLSYWFSQVMATPLHHFILSLLALDPQVHPLCPVFNPVPSAQLGSLALDSFGCCALFLFYNSYWISIWGPVPSPKWSVIFQQSAPGSEDTGHSLASLLHAANIMWWFISLCMQLILEFIS